MISTADEGKDCALFLIVVHHAYYFLVLHSEETTNSFLKDT